MRSRAGGDSGPPRLPLAGAGSPALSCCLGNQRLTSAFAAQGWAVPLPPPTAAVGCSGDAGELWAAGPLPPCPQQPPGLGILTAALLPFPRPPGLLLPAVGAGVPAASVVNSPGRVSRRLAPAPGQTWLCQAEPRALAPLPEQDRPPRQRARGGHVPALAQHRSRSTMAPGPARSLSCAGHPESRGCWGWGGDREVTLVPQGLSPLPGHWHRAPHPHCCGFRP